MVIAGTRFRHDWNFKNKSTGEVIDISSMTFECDLYKADTRQKLYTMTMGSGLSFVDDGTNGALRLSITGAQTKQGGPGMWRYILRRTDEDNDLWLNGSFPIEAPGYDA